MVETAKELFRASVPLLSRGGVSATSRNNREASFGGAGGVVLVKKTKSALDQHHPVCAGYGGFAISSQARSHPSSAEEGTG